jgi:regulator of protease activity HflC (stomatin/prohibitin superfamily)
MAKKLQDKIKKLSQGAFFTIAIVFIGFIAFTSTFVTIKSGTVGVIRRFGKVNRIANPGLAIKIPFVEDTIVYNTQKVVYETSSHPDSSEADYTDYPVDTTTKDGQPVQIKYSIRFNVDSEDVTWVAENIGDEEDIIEKVIKTDSRVYVRGFAREYAAADLYTGNIVEVQREIETKLKEEFENNGLSLDSFGIRSIDFSEEYVNAIEQKQIEKEKVTTEEYKAEQEEYKKKATITRAEAEAEKQKLLQKTITDELLQKMWIEKWDGKLPEVMTGSDQQVIYDLNDK